MKHIVLALLLSCLTIEQADAQHKLKIERVYVELNNVVFEKLDSVYLKIKKGEDSLSIPYYLAICDTFTLVENQLRPDFFRRNPAINYVPHLSFKPFNGTHLTYHNNGKTKLRCRFKYGQLDGMCTSFDQYERPVFWEMYSSGRRYSYMTYHPELYIPQRLMTSQYERQWYTNGILASELDLRSYSSREWYETGEKKEVSDRQNNIYKTWYENGQLKSKSEDGISTRYDSVGNMTQYSGSGVLKQWKNNQLVLRAKKDTLNVDWYYEYFEKKILVQKVFHTYLDEGRTQQQSVTYHFKGTTLISADTIVFIEEEEPFETGELFYADVRSSYPGGLEELEAYLNEQHELKKSYPGEYEVFVKINEQGEVIEAYGLGAKSKSAPVKNIVRLLKAGKNWTPGRFNASPLVEGVKITIEIQ